MSRGSKSTSPLEWSDHLATLAGTVVFCACGWILAAKLSTLLYSELGRQETPRTVTHVP